MSGIWSRAWRSIIRRPRRSVLMVAIIAVVFTALVAQSGVKATMQDVKDAISHNVSAGFTAQSSSGVLSETQIKKLSAVPGVSRQASEAEFLAKPTNAKLVNSASGIQLDPQFGGDLGVTGTNDSALNPAFQGKLFTLEAGKHISGNVPAAMIHHDFARQNLLRVGDVLELRHEEVTVKLKVAGIFTGKTDNPTGLPSGASENRVFTDLGSAQKLGGQVNIARFFTARADQLPATLQAAKKAVPKLTFENNSAQFADVLQAISGVDGLLRMLLWGFCLAGGAVLALVSAFWVRGRLPEIGILLSLGKTKLEVGLQFIVEACVFGIVASVLATIAGLLLSSRLGALVLAKAGDDALAALQPANNAVDIAVALAIGFAVIFIALVLALFPILRHSPKQILAKLS